MSKRVVVQIGLHTSYEWAYLSRDNWTKNYPPERQYEEIPEFFLEDPEPFSYYGVDAVPESIAYCSDAAKTHEYNNAQFICLGVSDEFNSTAKHGVSFWSDADWNFIDISDNTIYPTVTMLQLFDLLNLERIDILGLDIDGYEHIIFNNMEYWRIMPKYMSIEMHGYLPFHEHWCGQFDESSELPKRLVERLAQHGYQIYKVFEDDYGMSVVNFLRVV